jgi:hypothetical protein
LCGIILYIPTDKALQADGHRREDNERNHKSPPCCCVQSENDLRHYTLVPTVLIERIMEEIIEVVSFLLCGVQSENELHGIM